VFILTPACGCCTHLIVTFGVHAVIMLSVLVSTVHMATVLAPREPSIRQKYMENTVNVAVFAKYSESKHYHHFELKINTILETESEIKRLFFVKRKKKISAY